jgi:hypothetical protein
MARYREKDENITQWSLEIYADPLIKRVFYHLLYNAIRYGQTMTKIDWVIPKIRIRYYPDY